MTALNRVTFSISMYLVGKDFFKAIKEIIASNLTIKHIPLMAY